MSHTFVPTPPLNDENGYAEIELSQCLNYTGTSRQERVTVSIPENCRLFLHGCNGADLYILRPASNSVIFLSNFSLEVDIIDLSLFPLIHRWKDVKMTAGSVRIHLPGHMTVVLLYHSPADMTAKHFILNSGATPGYARSLTIAFVVLSVLTIILLVKFSITVTNDYHDSNVKAITVHPEDKLHEDIETGRQAKKFKFTEPVNRNIDSILEGGRDENMERSSNEDKESCEGDYSESEFDPFAVYAEISSESSCRGFDSSLSSESEDDQQLKPTPRETRDDIIKRYFDLTDEELRGVAGMSVLNDVKELFRK